MRKAIFCALAAAAALASSATAQSQRVAVAIARFDGRLVPFAAYDGGRWARAWPDADSRIEAPRTVDDVDSIWRRRRERVPRVWHVWPASGGASLQARVNGVEVAETHCVGQLALRTDLPPRRGVRPLKFGIAVDSAIPVTAVEPVLPSDPLWATATRLALANFFKLESAAAQTHHVQLPRETPAPTSRLTMLFRERSSPRSPLYFVAEKKYRTAAYPQDPTCERVTVMTGWLVPTTNGALELESPTIFLSDCDRKEVSTATPLGAIHIGDRLFWVLQEDGYESENYIIADIASKQTRYVVEVHGGGC
jgi:hypothetical protein